MGPDQGVRHINWGGLFALLFGGLLACLTLAIERLSAPTQIPIVGDPRPILFALLGPGILGSMAISGNAHAWHLWIAAGINGIVYFGLGWLIIRLIARLFGRKQRMRQAGSTGSRGNVG
jgi:hypothetical protein